MRLVAVRQTAIAIVVGSVCLAGQFVVTTAAIDQVPDAALVGVPLLVAAIVASFVWGLPTRKDLGSAVGPALAGALAWWAAPFAVLGQRASDAPSGAEVLFLTASLWGVGVLLVAALRRGVTASSQLAAGLLSAAGALAILANWERPSSFSPFAHFLGPELAMVGSGVVFGLGLHLLHKAVGSQEFGPAFVSSLWGAALVGLVAWLPAMRVVVGEAPRLWTFIVVIGVLTFGSAWAATRLVRPGDISLSSVPFLLTPAVVTGLSALERVIGVYGPNPILWEPVLGGTAVVVTAAVVILMLEADKDPSVPSTPAATTARIVAIVAVAAALAALALPVLSALSEGAFSTPFRARWDLAGYESASAWIVAGAAVLVLALSSGGALRRATRRVGAACAVVSVAGAWLARSTSIRTYFSWIPDDVQTTYGTEYARFVVEPVASPALWIASAAVLAAAVALLIHRPGEAAPGD